MQATDILIGAVAIALGLLPLWAAVTNWQAAYKLPSARRIETRFGRRAARIFYAALGTLLVVLGVLIASGFGPNASQNRGSDARLPLHRDDARGLILCSTPVVRVNRTHCEVHVLPRRPPKLLECRFVGE